MSELAGFAIGQEALDTTTDINKALSAVQMSEHDPEPVTAKNKKLIDVALRDAHRGSSDTLNGYVVTGASRNLNQVSMPTSMGRTV